MEDKKQRGLRKGYTTGTCAAAASKAAAIAFLTKKKVKDVEVTLPVGKAVIIPVHRCGIESERAIASVIKEAGDDPDVTNGAEIVCELGVGSLEYGVKAFEFTVHSSRFTVYGGKGIGIVTKPGLAIPIGEPAINPVPRKMIEEAIKEAISNFKFQISNFKFSVTISVPNGEEIAKKTMNARLGIIGGISILGTTGIVEPVSLSAYRDSIKCAIDVAMASGCKEIVFSTGRSSEKIAEQILNLPEEAFILVGDHMGFALKEARGKGRVGWAAPTNTLRKITLVGQFGKFSKLAAGHFETHCSDSSVELEFLAHLAKEAGAKKDILEGIKNANTARHVFFMLKEQGLESIYRAVCNKVKENTGKIVEGKAELGCMLIGYDNEVVEKL
ncbi:MAG: cobalt-precorrin-5B (C(1))-methyltransferase [Deltaproteobacteria bacterium]|nr:cobalt-precorrin-5B (C(1))-methyltransferase [Deltaproteobacteria bacterium]